MRGTDRRDEGLFSYVSLEERIPADHPLRSMRELVEQVLEPLSGLFEGMYSTTGRPSIAPERLMRASLIQALYSIRSERQLVEQLNYNLLFRWFVGLSIDDPVWDASTFSKNRERLLAADVGKELFAQTAELARRSKLLSSEHFSVDGTLIAAWASQKSVRRRDGQDDDKPDGPGHNAGRNFKGEQRRNDTHASRTDPEAPLARKSNAHPARPSYAGHVLMENRHGLLVDVELTAATGTAERDAALAMAEGLMPGSSLGADKAYDTQGFVADLRELEIVPHVAQNLNRRGGSAIDGRTTRHRSYQVSQVIRKRIEEAFGWGKEIGGLRQTKLRGVDRVRQHFEIVMSAYNLLRIRNLLAPG
ncbi:MAG: IS5 family transposase [Candidatus Binataceae bacterium]